MEAKCLECSKDFPAQRASAKFCSGACRSAWNKKQDKSSVVEKRWSKPEEPKIDKVNLLREDNEALSAEVANLKKQNSELSFKVSELTKRLSENQPSVQVRDFSSAAPKANFVIDTLPKDIQKQIEELKSATKPSMIGKANFERWRSNEIKKLQLLQNQ